MSDNNKDGEIHTWSGGKCPVHPKSVVHTSSHLSGQVRDILKGEM